MEAQPTDAPRHVARQTAIFRGIAEVLNRSYTLREALDGALHRIVELMDVDAGWIFLHGPEPGEFRMAADVNLPPALSVSGKRRMAGDCRCISMLREGRLAEPVNFIDCARLEQALPQSPERHRHASVPLIAQDETVGILNLLLPPGRSFAAEELDLLEALGHEIAVAVQRARLFDQVREQEHTRRQLLQRLLVAQEEERRRIARDLHDHAGQMMTALIIQLAQLTRRAESEDGPLAPALRKLHDLAQQGLDELRKLVYELRPSILDDLGLGPALRWYADTYVHAAGLRADVHIGDIGQRLPQEVETVVFRIVQEAVTNALRHAQARQLEIRVDRRGGFLLVMVRDDGTGFDSTDPEPRATLGLAGMRERAQLVGGTLQVLSVPGVGTTVLARIPLHDESGG
ncbi:MAG: sensor histidine kinase [Armatimonadota bacterium]|nr:sensor histidine kinase [Armatimonadota bacterium]MDR5697776.1 sensor histidine kinase [Armatimonadota bacterium]